MNFEAIHRSWRAWIVDDERDAGPWWAPYVWTLLFCCVVAIGFTVLAVAVRGRGGNVDAERLWTWYQVNLGISLCVGFSIHFLFMATTAAIGRPRLRRFEPWQRTTYYSVVPIIGTAIGWPLGVMWMTGIDIGRWIGQLPRSALVTGALVCALVTLVFHVFFATKARQILAEKRAAEAQLRLLQAQIEPHFLFNTLANVVSLMESDTARAKAMLESFVDYLRASMPALGSADAASHTLGSELDLVEAYLRIVQTRMEDRLRYTIDVPAELRALPLPPLMVQPLVENAVVHGLEPTIDGGSVRVTARHANGALVLTIDDDGAGPGAKSATSRQPRARSTGTALANIRERLRQTYGRDAVLTLVPGAVRGSEARLVIPSIA